MWLLLLLTAPFLAIATDPSTQECFDEAATKYVTCKPIYGRPAACDCTYRGDPCYIKMIISKRKVPGVDGFHYLINQTFQGPTIIVEQYGIVVIDLSNEMDEDTSIHFHGMRQRNVPWMDGVGNVTQYPIPANGRFRYIVRADPQGTHWYHAHMRYQKDHGLFGSFIVHEAQNDIHEKLGPFEDQPARTTLAITDRMVNINESRNVYLPFCLPDGSHLPIQFVPHFLLFINGGKLTKNVLESAENESYTRFYVVSGKNYRFRIIAATLGTVFMMSIDHHKMYVMATDGYPVKPFETDFLIMHVGETYDFILKAKKDVLPGSKYPIKIQSLAVHCNNNSKLAGESFAFLVYTNKSKQMRPIIPENLIVQNDRCNNESNPCTILNCPFKIMPTDYSKPGTYMKCYDVLSLQLLYPTPYFQIPRSADIASEFFFNLEGVKPKASIINGVKFRLPDVPVLESEGVDECRYPVKGKNIGRFCTHTVHLTQFNTATRFVISSINQGQPGGENITHPVHMHGHTFFIAKIQYPEYYDNGTLKAPNKDLTMSFIGPPEWRDGTPGEISVTSTTVRKDTVMIPAGGYVVIHFIQDNPGYWYMHCHTDWHLNDGMAIVIVVNPDRASSRPNLRNRETKDFCFSVKTFLSKEAEYPGNKEKVFGPNPEKLWNLGNYEEVLRPSKENAANFEEVGISNQETPGK